MTVEAKTELEEWPEEGSIKFFSEKIEDILQLIPSKTERRIIEVNSGLYGPPLDYEKTGKLLVPPISAYDVSRLKRVALKEQPALEILYEVKKEYGYEDIEPEEKPPVEDHPHRNYYNNAPEKATEDSNTTYLQEISKHKLLTAVEEVDLAQKIEAGVKAQEKLVGLSTNSKKRKKLEEITQTGVDARITLIESNLRLVVSIARKYINRGLPLEDLIEEGNLGLMRATEKYKWEKGYRFSTYATWWIRQAVGRSLADLGNTIRWPVHFYERANHFTNTEGYLVEMLGRIPTIADIQIELVRRGHDYTLEQLSEVKKIVRQQKSPDSLNSPIRFVDGETELIDIIPSKDTFKKPDDEAIEVLVREKVHDALDNLPPRDALVLSLRFGLKDGRIWSLDQVGKEIGVSRERVRQIERDALTKLRNPARGLNETLGAS